MYELLDGIKANKENPDTFYIPSEKEKSNIEVGGHVKLSFIEKGNAPERMWVKVKLVNDDNLVGVLDNDPYNLSSVKYGDEIKFNSKHIINIM